MIPRENTSKDRLSQNIVSLVGEIGEKQVLLRLAILAQGTRWRVSHNLGEAGYDILMLDEYSKDQIHIEVKTRQRLYTTGEPQRNVHFLMSDGEYQACDCVVAYFVDLNAFFIMPKMEFKPYKVNNRQYWRTSLSLVARDKARGIGMEYLYAWDKIHPDLKPCKMAFEYEMQKYLRKALENGFGE